MGDIADDISGAYNYWGPDEYREDYQIDDPTQWVDASGVIHDIVDMNTNHIENTIKYLEKKRATYVRQYPVLVHELKQKQNTGNKLFK